MSRRRWLLLAGCLGLSACAGKPNAPVNAGFLHDYDALGERRAASGQTVRGWVAADLKPGSYHKVYLEPTWFNPALAPSERIPLSTLINIGGYYDAALRRELGKVMTVVDSPGPDTLVVKPAITRVATHTQGLRFYEWLPVTLVAAGVSSAVGIRDQDSEIATEVSFEAGTSGRVVAELQRTGTGTPLENDRQVLTAHEVKAVLDGWADDLRQDCMGAGNEM
ncbi:DUF3313 domain-containing protein [Pantoea sp. Cy-639]|uniref:DUF3313 domain-containing protein n=1 Tax=Pantoea sp. Cy-639 TaxID=2608360 RepID=UPI0014200E02|nr:DUF3313 domain-containing protein [Pantoea sp. Cy-639]NIF19695.1 DUF3313 domain-containing protein [Pantoea sp. Cy-639]